MPITVTLEIPEDLAALLRSGGRDLSRAALEALAVEEYRARRLSDAQFRRLLGLSRLPDKAGAMSYLVAIGAGGALKPEMLTTSGVAGPAATPAGMRTSISYTPTKPGANPENRTSMGTPPTVTVGNSRVRETGLAGAGRPVGTLNVTGPSPLA